MCVYLSLYSCSGFVYPWAMLRSTEIELKTAFVVKVFTWESKRYFCESHLTRYFAPGHESLAIRGRAYSYCRVKHMSTLPHFHDACLALRLHCKVFLCKMCLVAGTNYAAFRFHVKVKKKKKVVCSCSVMMLWCVIYPWTHGCLY